MTKPKRGWFRFSLRTLFVAVTLTAVAMAWLILELKTIRERQEVLALVERAYEVRVTTLEPDTSRPKKPKFNDQGVDYSYARVPYVRRLLGDRTHLFIWAKAYHPHDPDLLHRLEKAYPEATLVFVVLGRPPHDFESRESLYKPVADRRPNEGGIFKTGLIQHQPSAR